MLDSLCKLLKEIFVPEQQQVLHPKSCIRATFHSVKSKRIKKYPTRQGFSSINAYVGVRWKSGEIDQAVQNVRKRYKDDPRLTDAGQDSA